MSSNEGNKHPEAFAEAFKGGLGAANNALLLSCSLAGAGLGLYAELGGSAISNAAGWVAICVWLLAIAVSLYLAGRQAGATRFLDRIKVGFTFARHNAGFALFVLLLTSGAVFSVWSKSKSERAAREGLETVVRDSETIKQAVTRSVPPIEALAKIGYTTSSDDVCRAIQARNAQVTGLLANAGVRFTNLVVPLGSGAYELCIEPLLLDSSRASELTTLLAAVAPSAADLDRYFVAQRASDAYEPLRLTQLLSASGWRARQELSKFEEQLAAAMPKGTPEVEVIDVRATQLMFAVWADNTTAVRALLSLGSDPDLGARIGLQHRGAIQAVLITASPLEEAQRLGRIESMALLQDRNARRLLSRGAYRP